MDIQVFKRNGSLADFDPTRISTRLYRIVSSTPRLAGLDVTPVAKRTVASIAKGMSTSDIDTLSANVAAAFVHMDTRYGELAGIVLASNRQRRCPLTYLECCEQQAAFVQPRTGKVQSVITDELLAVVRKHHVAIHAMIKPERDMRYDFFGLSTLISGKYLRTRETPQYALMRVAIGIHGDDLANVKATYDGLSLGLFTHASPTLLNAGRPKAQMASCFLTGIAEDSIPGIMGKLTDAAIISKFSGGVGINVGRVRAEGSFIAGTNGESDGVQSFAPMYNHTSRCIRQGGRPASYAWYIPPFHADIRAFLDLRKNTGSDEKSARRLFYGMWIPDLFMERCAADAMWSLFSYDESPRLFETYGDEFEQAYLTEEASGAAREVVPAREVMRWICVAQIETGGPYMCYSDSANRKSNQRHLGFIQCSNLCTEIMQYSDADEIAVCNLASIALPKFIGEEGKYDFPALRQVVAQLVTNLDRLIDCNVYPLEAAERSNKRHRPMGIGIQGLADVFAILRLPYASDEARHLAMRIMAHIYYAALERSCELAHKKGSHPSYPGSPMAEGMLSPDLWDVAPEELVPELKWGKLRNKINKFGVRASLVTTMMPTATTAQILGNNESFEPFTSNIYVRRVQAGEFQVVNRHLMRDLDALGLWNEGVVDEIMRNGGSIATLPDVPDEVKELYKTAWEIPHNKVVELVAAMAPFIDQSVSLNAHIARPTIAKLASMHMDTWKRGLKTGMYYLRAKAVIQAPTKMPTTPLTPTTPVPPPVVDAVCSRDNPDCIACSA